MTPIWHQQWSCGLPPAQSSIVSAWPTQRAEADGLVIKGERPFLPLWKISKKGGVNAA
jgi:hypothetical protein